MGLTPADLIRILDGHIEVPRPPRVKPELEAVPARLGNLDYLYAERIRRELELRESLVFDPGPDA
jgi:hypothetical protein